MRPAAAAADRYAPAMPDELTERLAARTLTCDLSSLGADWCL